MKEYGDGGLDKASRVIGGTSDVVNSSTKHSLDDGLGLWTCGLVHPP